MIKKCKYTIISLMFAIVFVIGSMIVTNYIFRHRETRMLADKGIIEVDTPVREWEGWENNDGNSNDGDTNVSTSFLSMKQIEDVVRNWNNRTGITLHNQVAGQISMEEAIENGKKWLAEMEIGDVDIASLSVNAELGVGTQNENNERQFEAYYSFWIVTYSNQSMSTVLYLNAVTGNVWGAEFTLYEEGQKKISSDSLRLFAELAGLQVSDQDSFVTSSGETQMEIAIEGSSIYAQGQFYSMLIGLDESYVRKFYRLVIK